MSSRGDILKLIEKNKPGSISLSLDKLSCEQKSEDLLEIFKEALYNVGGSLQIIDNLSVVKKHLLELAATGERILNMVEELDFPVDIFPDQAGAAYYETVYAACIKGTAGVAENAAVWVEEAYMGNRLIPFICEHLILVLYRSSIVENMHEVFKKIESDATSYGVFIAGPSKTADIEQSLVIGAHGARSLKVFIVDR